MDKKILDKDAFINLFSKNLKKNIDKNFKTQKEFAEFFNEPPQTVNKWVKGINLPDIYKIYKICENMDITTDSLIKGKNPNLTDINIDYLMFDEVTELVNDYAKKYQIKKVSSKEYFTVYYAIQKFKDINSKRMSIQDTFEILEDILLSHLKKKF